MKRTGHIGVALILGAPISYLIHYSGETTAAIAFIATVALTCNLPDIDIKLQRITGKNGIPIIRDLVQVTHRGKFHSLYFAIVVGILIGLLAAPILTSTVVIATVAGGFSGVLFHLIGDVVTPTGINILPPVSGNHSFNLFRFDNLVANAGATILGLASVAAFWATAMQPSVTTYISVGVLYGVAIPIVTFTATKLELRHSGKAIDRILSFPSLLSLIKKLF